MPYRQTTLEGFLTALAARTPAPGGGASCALAGATGAALGSMCAAFTTGHEKYREVEPRARELLAAFDALRETMLELVDRDAAAYQGLVDARRLPKETEAQKETRRARVLAAQENATRVPEEILERAEEGLALTERMGEICNLNLIADAAVGAALLESAARGAYVQVTANLAGAAAEPAARERRERAHGRRAACEAARARIEALVLRALEK